VVAECAALGIAHPVLGQAIVLVAASADGSPEDDAALLARLRERLPAYMVPARVAYRPAPLPRNPNGKIDRKSLATAFDATFVHSP
jgi:acyl-coenzyme A synthetase/AMP-(fatty) acid ligase